MNWFAAHLIEYAKFKDGIQDYYPFYENVVLIEANSAEEAWDKATQFGKESESNDESVTWNDRPVNMVFAGVRKIIAPARSEELNSLPKHGTELTYSLLVIDKEEDFRNYVNNEPADVHYDE